MALEVLKIVTGITTVTGLIGLIFYIVLMVTEKGLKTIFSQEIINSLKSTNLKPADFKDLSPSKVRLLLEHELDISKQIINQGVKTEINRNAKLLIIVTIGLLLCAIVFGCLLVFKTPNPLIFNGFVFDQITNKPISDAIIEIENRKDIPALRTDNHGYFQIKVSPMEITLSITHKNYKSIAQRIGIVLDNGIDSFRLEPINDFYLRKLSGSVVDFRNSPIANVKIFMVGDSTKTYTNAEGYFMLEIKQITGQSSRIRAIKSGYTSYDEYFSETDDNITILLKK